MSDTTDLPVPSEAAPRDLQAEVSRLEARVAELEALLEERTPPAEGDPPSINVAGVPISWNLQKGTFDFLGLPGVSMWIDSTMAGLLSGLQAMVGSRRFALCLQSQGRKGVEADWAFLLRFPDFEQGFAAMAQALGAAGWGRWELAELDRPGRVARFRVWDSWEGRCQKSLGVCWGSGITAGKLAGLCGKLFGTNCWADQTAFVARGDACDAFTVAPSERSVEGEIEALLHTDEATRADMAVALERLRAEINERVRAEEALNEAREDLEQRVEIRTSELADANERLLVEVTERRRAEELFRRVAEGIPHPLAIIAEPDFGALYVNPAFTRVLGYSLEEVPSSQAWFSLAHPDPSQRESVAKLFYENITHPGSGFSFERRIRCKGGEFRDFYLQIVPLAEGRYLVLGHDLTALKTVERERGQLVERLHRAQKMEALGLLAGGVAHDLNNILSGLVTYPDLILDSLPEGSSLRGPVQVVQEAGIRAAAVVADLVTIARGVAVPRERFSLNRMVEKFLSSSDFPALFRAREGVRVETRLSPRLLPVMASEVHLRKSLTNLVVNGLEALNGGGRVVISTENRNVDLPLPGFQEVPVGEYVVLSVEDDGPGIRAEDLPRIFEPFFTKKVMGRSGTGLGLAVVWNAVQDHQGYVQVTSEPGHTRFDLFLPACREGSEEGEPVPPLPAARGRGERILVVDDEASQREISCRLLESLGYHAEAAASGEEAVGRLEREPFDVVLLDMIMPRGLNGRAAYERILHVRPGQRAIIASGYAETEEVREAQRLGAGTFLRKPYRAADLGAAIRAALESPDEA